MQSPRSSTALMGLFGFSLVLLAAPPMAAAQTAASVYAWHETGRGIESTQVTAVAVSPDRPGVLWVGAGGAVYRSRDGGESWDRRLMVRGIGAHFVLDDVTDEAELDELALRDAADEIAAEVREQVIDDLSDEYGNELAEEMADDFAESLVDEVIQDLEQADLPEGVDRRRLVEDYGADPLDVDEFERTLGAEAIDPGFVEEEDRIFRIDASTGGRVLVGTSGGLFISVDEGETFRQLSVGIGEEEERVLAVRWDPTRTDRFFAGTEDGLWVSLDQGLTFTRAGGLTDRGAVQDVAVDRRDPNRVLVATQRGLLRSDDGGISFMNVWSPTDEELGDARAVDFDGRLPGRVYAGTAGGLLLSSDGGDTFSRIDSPGLTTRVVNDLRVWPYRAGGLVVATPAGVFASRDGAQHFHEAYPGLPARDVFRVAPMLDAFPEVFVATSSGAFLWVKLPDEVPRLDLVSAIIDRGPPLVAVADAAMRFAEMESSWFQDTYRRAGVAWVLPQVFGVVRYVDNRAERHILQGGAAPRLQLDLDDDLRWEVRARWDLDGLIHYDRPLAVSRSWNSIRRERSRLLDRVTSTYSAWVSLSVRAEQVGGRDLREATMLALQIAEIEAQLDALTGGFFSQALAGG